MENAICIHAWEYTSEGDQTYCESGKPDGWAVYTRTDTGFDASEGSPFDIDNELDFPDYPAAMGEAYRRSIVTGFPIVEY